MTTTSQSRPLSGLTALKQIFSFFRWTRASYVLFSSFLLLLFLIGYVWWPLLEEYLSYYNPQVSLWRQIDWLLIGNFLFMTLMIMANADIKADLPVIVIGLLGGLAIEGWGTQTSLWTYYTNERPPLWIIPAWPIASLAIDRLYRLIKLGTAKVPEKIVNTFYWILFPAFLALMVVFIVPTLNMSLTILSLILCVFLVLTPVDHRAAVLIFIAGSGLGYFLELWGTTRLVWIYYTQQTPPLFAVFAHGMAAVAFWRVLKLYQTIHPRITKRGLRVQIPDPYPRNKI
jgi:hypothetical protein